MVEMNNSSTESEVVVYARPTRNGNFLCHYNGRFFYLSKEDTFLGHTNVGEWNWAAIEWKRKAEDRKVILPPELQ
jgi:hypothetical protein